MSHAAKVFAAQRYRLSTLTVQDDLLIAIVAGRKGLHTPSSTITAQPGHGILIARGTQWDVVNDPNGQRQYEALLLAFDDALVREFNHQLAADTQTVRSAQVIALDDELSDALQRTLPNGRSTSPALQRHRNLEVLLMLAEKGWHFASAQEQSWTERIQKLISQRPDANWSVAAIAQVFCMSESSLRRRLQEADRTLAALVRDVRLQTALGLLQTTDLSVGEVAQRCGWTSHSRFTAAFQQRWNVAPSVVRSRMKDYAQDLTDSG